MCRRTAIVPLALDALCALAQPPNEEAAPPVLRVQRTNDFEGTGAGSHAARKQAPWVALSKFAPEGPLDYSARFGTLIFE